MNQSPPRFLAGRPILPEGAREGDELLPDLRRDCVWLVRRLPPDYGRLLSHLTSGALNPLTLSAAAAADFLVAAANSRPAPPRPPRCSGRLKREGGGAA